jgi:hypothetical protein
MSRGIHHIRQSDLTKTLKAMAKAGLPVARIEITAEGRIVVVAGQPATPAEPGVESLPEGGAIIGSTAALDRELADWEARHGQG